MLTKVVLLLNKRKQMNMMFQLKLIISKDNDSDTSSNASDLSDASD